MTINIFGLDFEYHNISIQRQLEILVTHYIMGWQHIQLSKSSSYSKNKGVLNWIIVENDNVPMGEYEIMGNGDSKESAWDNSAPNFSKEHFILYSLLDKNGIRTIEQEMVYGTEPHVMAMNGKPFISKYWKVTFRDDLGKETSAISLMRNNWETGFLLALLKWVDVDVSMYEVITLVDKSEYDEQNI